EGSLGQVQRLPVRALASVAGALSLGGLRSGIRHRITSQARTESRAGSPKHGMRMVGGAAFLPARGGRAPAAEELPVLRPSGPVPPKRARNFRPLSGAW